MTDERREPVLPFTAYAYLNAFDQRLAAQTASEQRQAVVTMDGLFPFVLAEVRMEHLLDVRWERERLAEIRGTSVSHGGDMGLLAAIRDEP